MFTIAEIPASPRRKETDLVESIQRFGEETLLPPDAEEGLARLFQRLCDPTAGKPNILLIENDPNDVYLFKHALAQAGLDVELTNLTDGIAALDYLSEPPAKRKARPLPDIILLDLTMPRLPGLEVLRQIRSHDVLKDAVVCVLTASENPEDCQRANELCADDYLQKPPTFHQLVDLVRNLGVEWLDG